MLKQKLIVLSKYTVFVLLIFSFFISYKNNRWRNREVIKWDVTSYYSYLPALFIYKDLTLSFVKKDETFYSYQQMFWPEKTKDGRIYIKTTMGLALLYAPFFGLAHLEAHLTNEATDGFSVPYHRWIHFSVLFYFFIGLNFLKKFLSKFFEPLSVSLVLILITLATNAFYYITGEAAMSHMFSFSLVCIFLYLSHRFFEKIHYSTAIYLGLTAGMIFLIRPVNLLLMYVPLFFLILYQQKNKENFIQGIRLFLPYLFIALAAAFVILLPQMVYWKIATGDWIFYSYNTERFYFLQPHLWDGLFGYRKGWLIYTPLMFFLIPGFYFLFREQKTLFVLVFPLFCVYTYVVLSWWCWWYGGSFGLRAMIDLYPLLSIPIAAFVHDILNQNKPFFTSLVMTFFCGMIYLNLVQTQQYKSGILHWDSMTKEAYWDIFANSPPSEDFGQKLKAPDYIRAKAGLVEYPE